ncbi:MAG TPA: hypothetical protein PKH93_06485 [Chitinophagales bacterium]|nr:hypothetical protein [Chitinophagales bacterium]
MCCILVVWNIKKKNFGRAKPPKGWFILFVIVKTVAAVRELDEFNFRAEQEDKETAVDTPSVTE